MDVFALGIRTGVLQDPSPYSTIFSDPFSDTPTIVNKLKDSQKATKKQGKKKNLCTATNKLFHSQTESLWLL